jgi:hypothetical protein
MLIISHRGFWQTKAEKNTRKAFERSFDLGIGTETDVRDSGGKIVISHDMPSGGEMLLSEVLEIIDGRNIPLALNIKADGLGGMLLDLRVKYGHENYFTFDMSIPDMAGQMAAGLNVYTGLSDLLPRPVLVEHARGIWLDCFRGDWYDEWLVDDWRDRGKKVCVVSADLHGRDTARQWEMLKKARDIASDSLMLCTDKPLAAREYFGA